VTDRSPGLDGVRIAVTIVLATAGALKRGTAALRLRHVKLVER
jgi:hypothetical protein